MSVTALILCRKLEKLIIVSTMNYVQMENQVIISDYAQMDRALKVMH